MAITRPLRMKPDGSLIEMSDADMSWMRWLIRTRFAQSEQPGWLRINSAPSGWVSIGSGDDTRRSVGRTQLDGAGDQAGDGIRFSHFSGPGNKTQATYTFYQNRNDANIIPANLIRNAGPLVGKSSGYQDLIPLGYKGKTDIDDTVLEPVIDEIENGGNGIFYLGTTIPSGYSATGWSMTDTTAIPNSTSSSAQNDGTYQLSIRTGETPPSPVYRPVRIDGPYREGQDSDYALDSDLAGHPGDAIRGAVYTPSGQRAGTSIGPRWGAGIVEMSDDEIADFFLPYLHNRIGEGSRLIYQFNINNNHINCGSYVDHKYTGTSQAGGASGGLYIKNISNYQVINTYYLKLIDAATV